MRAAFIKEGNAWKLDDMRGERGDDTWSLRAKIK